MPWWVRKSSVTNPISVSYLVLLFFIFYFGHDRIHWCLTNKIMPLTFPLPAEEDRLKNRKNQKSALAQHATELLPSGAVPCQNLALGPV